MLFILLFSLSGWSQQQVIEPAPGVYLNARDPDAGSFGERELVIWSEDFENGIPADWILESDPTGGVWEYRGPSTNPSNDVGTRGSCVAVGNLFGPPIQSETADNGFIIFDSNYWDDNIGPCGSFGQGPAPGPHLATLTTSSIDLTGSERVGLSFNQYCKNFEATTSVKYSLDGGEWMDLWINDVPLNSGVSELNRLDRLNVSTELAGQANVRFQISFDGNYYFWMLDDFVLFELEEFNNTIDFVTYGDFNLLDQGHETGYEFMEYSLYPVEMEPVIKFNTDVNNWGAEDLTNCFLESHLRNELTMDTVYSGTSNVPINMSSDDFYDFFTPDFQLPLDVAPYTAHFEVIQDQEDTSPENNKALLDFEVTDVVYACDLLETEGIYVPDQFFAGSQYEVGNFFVITAENQAVHSVSVGIGAGTNPDATIYAKILKLSTSGSITSSEIAMSEEFGVTDYAYNNTGDNNFMSIPFTEPVALNKDSVYLVVVGSVDGPSEVFFPISGDSPILTSMVRFYPNSWFYLIRTPMIRMNFGPVVTVEEETIQAPTFNAYPNPADVSVKLEFNLALAQETKLVVYDPLGKVVQTENYGNLAIGTHVKELSTAQLENGWYIVSLDVNGVKQNKMIVVSH